MDHDAAVNLGAPERYVAGDLSQAERDEFETHFADCRPCMNDVWTASAFAANARAVFEDRLGRKPEPQRAGWLEWVWLPAAGPGKWRLTRGTGGRICQHSERMNPLGPASRRAAGSLFPGQAGPGSLLR